MQTDFAISSPRSERRKASTRRSAEGNFSSMPFIGCAEWIGRRTDADGAIFSGVARMALRLRERGDSAAAGRSRLFFLEAKSTGTAGAASMTKVIRSSRLFRSLGMKVSGVLQAPILYIVPKNIKITV